MDNVAVCEYCGQAFVSDALTEAEKKREAIMQCSCSGACSARRRLQKINEAKVELVGVMEHNHFICGADGRIDDETFDGIRKNLEPFIEHLVDGDVSGLTVQIPCIGKLTMSSTDKCIKISKRLTTGVERKIES